MCILPGEVSQPDRLSEGSERALSLGASGCTREPQGRVVLGGANVSLRQRRETFHPFAGKRFQEDQWALTPFKEKLFVFNWRIIALQYCVGFCHTST